MVIDDVFEQCLAGALGDPALNLALRQQRIDHRAAIVDDGVAVEFDRTGLGVDLDLADMAAVGKLGAHPVEQAPAPADPTPSSDGRPTGMNDICATCRSASSGRCRQS